MKKISHLFDSCFYSVVSKQVGDFFQIFVAFSEKLNFTYYNAKGTFMRKRLLRNCVLELNGLRSENCILLPIGLNPA